MVAVSGGSHAVYFREWRQWAGLSQSQLAKIMGISKPLISCIENGKRRWHSDFVEDFGIAVGARRWTAPLDSPPPGGGTRQPTEEEMAARREIIAANNDRRRRLEAAAKAPTTHKRGPRKKT